MWWGRLNGLNDRRTRVPRSVVVVAVVRGLLLRLRLSSSEGADAGGDGGPGSIYGSREAVDLCCCCCRLILPAAAAAWAGGA